MSRVVISALLTSVVFSSVVMADTDPISARQDLMDANKDAAKVIGGMLKEERPFDADAAMEALKTWQKSANERGDLFPEGSDTGHDTEAKATIWTDREGFDADMAEFKTAADAAVAAQPGTLEALNAAAGPVFKTCKSCHEDYRVEKD